MPVSMIKVIILQWAPKLCAFNNIWTSHTLHILNICVHVYKYIPFNLNLYVYDMSVGTYVHCDIYEC